VHSKAKSRLSLTHWYYFAAQWHFGDVQHK